MRIEQAKERHEKPDTTKPGSPEPQAKSWITRELALILGAAAVLIIGTATLIVPTFGGPKASGKYQTEIKAVFYDPILPSPAGIIGTIAQGEAIKTEAAAAAAKASSVLVGVPEIRFEQGDGLLIVTAKAGSEAGAVAAARAVFDYVVATYSAHPARQAAFSAYMAARDVGNIRIFGRALAEQALTEIPVAATILDNETKNMPSSLTATVIVLLVALIGLMMIYFGKEWRGESPKLPASTETMTGNPVIQPGDAQPR